MSDRPRRNADLLASRRWLDRRGRGALAALAAGVAGARERDAAVIGRALAEQQRHDAGAAWLEAAAGTLDPALAGQIGGWLVETGNPGDGEAVLRRAAEAGDASGALHLGRLLSFRGDAEAETWLERAIEMQPSLWDPLFTDLLLRGRPELAARWRELGADLGEPGAVMASAIAAGERGDLDRLRERLEELADPEQMIAVAAEVEAEEAREAALTTAARTGHARAQLELGRWLIAHERPAEAEPWLQAPVAAGLPEAQLLLAAAHDSAGNDEQADTVLRSAAEAGDGIAAHELGVRAADREDREAAAEWFCRAARAGVDEAIFSMSILHNRDMYAWLRWVAIAAARGNARAAYELGAFEREQNHPVEARAWLRRAADLGHPEAPAALAGIA